MKYSTHAIARMRRRIVSQGDVDAIVRRPARVALHDADCVVLHGRGPSGNTLRVVIDPMRQRVLSAWSEEGDEATDWGRDRLRDRGVLRAIFTCACRSDVRGAAVCDRCG